LTHTVDMLVYYFYVFTFFTFLSNRDYVFCRFSYVFSNYACCHSVDVCEQQMRLLRAEVQFSRSSVHFSSDSEDRIVLIQSAASMRRRRLSTTSVTNGVAMSKVGYQSLTELLPP